MSNINLSGINSLANPQTQAAGTRALIKLIQNLNTRLAALESSMSSAGIEEAPIDGTQYGREDGGWTEIVSASVSSVPSGGTIGQVLAKASGDDYDVEWADASGTETFVVTTVDTANSTTSLADITGLSFPVVSGNTYYWECNIFMTVTNVGHGAGIAPNGPSFTLLSWEVRVPSLVTGASYRRDNGWATNYTSTTSATTETVWPLRGFVTPSANGSVAMQVRAESDGNTVTVKAGSWLKWMQVK